MNVTLNLLAKNFTKWKKGKRNANFSKNYKQSFTNVIRFSKFFKREKNLVKLKEGFYYRFFTTFS